MYNTLKVLKEMFNVPHFYLIRMSHKKTLTILLRAIGLSIVLSISRLRIVEISNCRFSKSLAFTRGRNNSHGILSNIFLLAVNLKKCTACARRSSLIRSQLLTSAYDLNLILPLSIQWRGFIFTRAQLNLTQWCSI